MKNLGATIKDVRYGLEKETEELTDHIYKLEEKFSDLNVTCNELKASMETSKSMRIQSLDEMNAKNGHSEEFNAESMIKLKVIDDRIKNLTASVDILKQDVEKKADKIELVRMENVNVTKEVLMKLLPSEESKSSLKEEFKSEIAYFHKSIDELARAWDLKLVKLRKDIDMYSIMKEINTRAKEEDVKSDFMLFDNKISKLEQM